jgi:hypothetical protein
MPTRLTTVRIKPCLDSPRAFDEVHELLDKGWSLYQWLYRPESPDVYESLRVVLIRED